MNDQGVDLKYLLHIEQLCKDLYDNARVDLRLLHEQEIINMKWEDTLEYWVSTQRSVLGDIQAYIPFLAGYISTIKKRKTVDEVKAREIVTNLKRKPLLSLPHINDWYFNLDNGFEKAKNYVRYLDYLRLVIIDYVQNHSVDKDH